MTLKKHLLYLPPAILATGFAIGFLSCGGGEKNVPITRITLNKTTTTLNVGQKETLRATVTPSNATSKVSFGTTNRNVVDGTYNAKDKTGVIEAKGVGIAQVAVWSEENNSIEARCTVVVLSAGVALFNSEITLTVGATESLLATIEPSIATVDLPVGPGHTRLFEIDPSSISTGQAIIWSSDNASVATVDAATGFVTGVKIGTATITAKTQDGGHIATCNITVAASTSM